MPRDGIREITPDRLAKYDEALTRLELANDPDQKKTNIQTFAGKIAYDLAHEAAYYGHPYARAYFEDKNNAIYY
ncbi:MAG TPA: hypothetical protein VFN56_00245 [Candidatus Saccharimonadales bacterium]|nr:hypothetical protein [Candidatus Saccharimonadales bacterium]